MEPDLAEDVAGVEAAADEAERKLPATCVPTME